MTDQPCPEKSYKTAFDALMGPDRADVGPNAECKRCKQCGGWHVRAIAPLEEPKPEASEISVTIRPFR